MLVRHNTLNLATGALTDTGRAEWVTRACDVPLFTLEEKASGVCRTCASGWTHPENYPVDATDDATSTPEIAPGRATAPA